MENELFFQVFVVVWSHLMTRFWSEILKLYVGLHDYIVFENYFSISHAAHPAFRPNMSLCHRVASVVYCLSTIHKKCFSSLSFYPISISFGLFESSVPVHKISSRISEILIIN